jgi:hypothetical protein
MTKLYRTTLLTAWLLLTSSTALAGDKAKAPKQPTVYHADACQQIALKGAVGFSDTQDKPSRDTAMVCSSKSGSARVLREWRLEGWGDGDMFVVGR